MRAEILSIGTELLLGSITDTNASYLAARLASVGVDCYYISQVGDNPGRLLESFSRAWERSDLVVTTGGLGPTGDDLTREAIAEMLGEKMVVVPELEANLRAFFRRRGVDMPQSNLKQASMIPSASPISNPVGTAPGWWVKRETDKGLRQIVSMPGVPYEMHRMWEQEVEPYIARATQTQIVSRIVKVLGAGESSVEEMVKDLMDGANPTLAPYAKADGIHLRITAKAADRAEAEALISGLEAQVRERLGRLVYGTDSDTPQQAAADCVVRAGLRLALVEVGGPVAGSLSALLTELAARGRGDLAIGAVTVTDNGALRPILGEIRGEGLEEILRAFALVYQADVVVGVRAQSQLEPNARGAVSATATVGVLITRAGAEPLIHIVQQTWKTDPAEVRRLAGLAAYNMLRIQLLR